MPAARTSQMTGGKLLRILFLDLWSLLNQNIDRKQAVDISLRELVYADNFLVVQGKQKFEQAAIVAEHIGDGGDVLD